MNKRKKIEQGKEGEEEEEEIEGNIKFKKNNKNENFIELKNDKKEEQKEENEEKEKKMNESHNINIVLSKKNDYSGIIISKNEKIDKLEKDNLEKDKIIKELKCELLENKNCFYQFNEKMRFKEDSLQLLSYQNDKLTKENDKLKEEISILKQKLKDLSQNNNLAQINNNIKSNYNNNNVNNNLNNNNHLNFGNNFSINNIPNNFNFNNNMNNNNFINFSLNNEINMNNINNNNIPNNNIINLKNDNFIAPNNERKENVIELIPKKEAIFPIDKYKKPTLIGLQNIGATCFMNATLQCLSQTKKLTNYFLDEEHKNTIINNNLIKNNPIEYQLSPVYLELIQNLWKENGPKYYAPNNFMNRINEMNSLFKKGEAGDAKDFIIFILEQMHKELKKPLNLNNINNNLPLNQYDKNNTLINFFNEFTKETSIISDLFFGFSETTNICLNCKFIYNSQNKPNPICYNYGIFNVLIFPLEEVKNFKNNMSLMNFQNFYQGPTNIVSIDDCFYYNQKTDLFTGENKNYCNLCKQLSDSEYTSRIYVSPNILILILNRGKGNIYKVKMDFTNTIDISNYVIQKEKPKLIYNLYGVITHLGESGPNAHFVAACKSPVDGNWYRYNDAMVNPITDFNKDVYNFGIPYILFYEKAD